MTLDVELINKVEFVDKLVKTSFLLELTESLNPPTDDRNELDFNSLLLFEQQMAEQQLPSLTMQSESPISLQYLRSLSRMRFRSNIALNWGVFISLL